MKISNFPMAARIIEARAKLIAQRERGRVVVSIDGTSQDDEMAERARPIVIAVLNQRIDELDEDLRLIGVDPG